MFIVFGLILVFVLMLLAFIIALNSEANEKKSIFGGLEAVLFLVMMPKNDLKKDDSAQNDEKIMISQMEQIFINFLYLKKSKMFQAPASVAFEIASQLGSSDISFYVSVPKYLESALEKYVQGVYPRAIVEKIPQDYTIFEPQGTTAGAYLKLSQNYLFPISTYQNLEKDPLSAVTNNLSKISANEGAAVQVIIRPSSGLNLRKKGEKALKKIREGKQVREAARLAFQGILMDMIDELLKPSKDPKKKEFEQANKEKEQGIDQKDMTLFKVKFKNSRLKQI